MTENRIVLKLLDDGTLQLHTDSPILLDDFITATLTAQLSMMQHCVDDTPEEIRQGVKQNIYDMYNNAASYTLAKFAPELELHPNLTTQAILEAENKIIQEGRLCPEQMGT